MNSQINTQGKREKCVWGGEKDGLIFHKFSKYNYHELITLLL
jgi:hypothetical protein